MTARLLKSRSVLSAATALALLALLVGCSRSDISARPSPDKGPPIALEPEPSRIGALVKIPIGQATEAVNAALPPSYAQGWTNGPDFCAKVIFRDVCVGTKYQFNTTRGTISLAPAGPDAILVTVPVSVSGQGGFRGDGARLLGLDAKNFDAAAVFSILLRPSIDSDWCPKLDVSADYRWTQNPRVEIVSKVNVDITGQVRDKLNAKLPEITQLAQNAIDCTQIKARIATLYGNKSFPIELSPNQQLHVNVHPTDIAFSGLSVDTADISLAAMLTAKIDVSATPIKPEALALPPLRPLDAGAPPRIHLSVPLKAPFELLRGEAKKFVVGKTFEQQTPAGVVKVTINDATVYATEGGKLAVGIDFDAKLPGKVLDTKGTVFLTGAPATEGPTVVRLKDVSYTRILDNDVWNAVSVLFDSQIRGALEQNLRYDLAGDIEKAKAALATNLADPAAIPNVKLTVSDVVMGLRRIQVGRDELAVEAVFEASVKAEPAAGAPLIARN